MSQASGATPKRVLAEVPTLVRALVHRRSAECDTPGEVCRWRLETGFPGAGNRFAVHRITSSGLRADAAHYRQRAHIFASETSHLAKFIVKFRFCRLGLRECPTTQVR